MRASRMTLDRMTEAARTTWHWTRSLLDGTLTDRQLGTSTRGLITLNRLGLQDPERVGYEPSPWRTVRRVLPPDEVGADDVFIDVGAGKGRVVIEAAVHYDFGRVIGLELSPELAAVARANVAATSGIRCPNVEIVVGDATRYRLPDDVSVIFLYNPIRGSAFAQFMAGVAASLDRRPRPLRIVYRTPMEHEWLLGGGFRLVREHRPRRLTPRLRETGSVRLYEAIAPGPIR